METNTQAVIDTAKAAVAPHPLDIVGSLAYYALPTTEMTIAAVNLETGLPNPARKRGVIKVFDTPSFNAVMADNTDAGNIVVYVDRDAENPAIVAVMNASGREGPGWGDFQARIEFRFTPQWKKWRAIDGQMKSQIEFAQFIEDNIADIAAPSGADMLEIAQYLDATQSADFKSGVRLSNGTVQFQNIETVDARVGASAIAVPEVIVLGIAPVIGVPPFRIEARFRYRISGGKLLLGIKLQRIEDIMARVVNDFVEGTAAEEGRMAVPGIAPPDGGVLIEGIAPAATK